jgi:hypothetical protein
MNENVMISKIAGLAREVLHSRNGKMRKIRVILFDRGLRILGPRVTNKNVIYTFDRANMVQAKQEQVPEGFQVHRCTCINEVPSCFWPALRAMDSKSSKDEFITHFSKRGVFWIGTLAEKPACHACSIRARDLKQWYIPLRPDDVVIFSVCTWPGFRGMGLARSLVHHIVSSQGGTDTNFYLDTKEWNRTAQATFERIGFQRIAVRPPLQAGG